VPMDTNQDHSFSSLTPDCMLNALESIGLRCDGRLLALNSYENRVYQVGIEDSTPLVQNSIVLHAGRTKPSLKSMPSCRNWLNARYPSCLPWRLTAKPCICSMASVFQSSSSMAVVRRNWKITTRWNGWGVSSAHPRRRCDQGLPASPHTQYRNFGTEPRDFLLANGFIPADIDAAYRSVAQQALDGVRHCFDRAGEVKQLRLHGDCHAGNVLWTEEGPHFVDFDDSRMGLQCRTCGCCSPANAKIACGRWATCWRVTKTSMNSMRAKLHLIEALRTLRLLHYSAWLAKRWDDAASNRHSRGSNTQIYWQNRILELREQIALMDEPPLWQN